MKLKLKNGNVQIFSNMLLCGNETKRFQDIIERSDNYTDYIQNNGGKYKCSFNTIETSFYVLSHDSCSIRWKDNHNFNNFIIQYVPIKSTKFLDDTMLLERDSCSSYGWQHVFVKELHYRHDGLLEYNLTNLNQFTNYAFIVQTYQYGFQTNLNNTEYDGAISPVKTFRTLLNIPSRVMSLETISRTSSNITLQWAVVENEEQAIDFFYIDVLKKPYNQTLIDRRNYCADPIKEAESDKKIEKVIENFRDDQYRELIDNEQTCCDNCCRSHKERQVMRDKNDFDFEASLEKFSEKVPRRNLEPRVEIKKHRNFIQRVMIKAEQRNYTIKNLDPFTFYTFYLQACSSDLKCSDYEQQSEMTQMFQNDSFDRVELEATSYELLGKEFHVRFKEPRNKNGVITSYFVELHEVSENSSSDSTTFCISRREHELNNFR